MCVGGEDGGVFLSFLLHLQGAAAHLKNQDKTADEFDSTALKVEKEIGGGSEGGVRLQLLGVGCYPFMGEFNPETAQGVVIAE